MSIFSKIIEAIFRTNLAPEEVADILDKDAAAKGERLDWRHSVVDLMKTIGIDSSLDARQQLAKEIGYEGDINDSANMNIWLHKQIMLKLAAHGGKFPWEFGI